MQINLLFNRAKENCSLTIGQQHEYTQKLSQPIFTFCATQTFFLKGRDLQLSIETGLVAKQIAPTGTTWFLCYCSTLQIIYEQNSVAAPPALGQNALSSLWIAQGDRCWQPWQHGQMALASVTRGSIKNHSASIEAPYTQCIKILHNIPRDFDRYAGKKLIDFRYFPTANMCCIQLTLNAAILLWEAPSKFNMYHGFCGFCFGFVFVFRCYLCMF